MRVGKTQQQIGYIKEQLKDKETVLVAGLISPTEYLNILGEGFEAEEVFSSIAENVKVGYKFRKAIN